MLARSLWCDPIKSIVKANYRSFSAGERHEPSWQFQHRASTGRVCSRLNESRQLRGGPDMPYGGNDWLALTQESTLEPEIAICDSHHPFWDFRSARIPYQRYLLHELIADVDCGHNVRSTVF